MDQNWSSPPVYIPVAPMGTEQTRENPDDFIFVTCVPQIRTGLVSFEFNLQGGCAD